MSVKETRFNIRLRKEFKARGIRIDRIESHALAAGIPDDAFLDTKRKKSGWIEIKEEETIPFKIKYRPKQPLWLQSYSNDGGICCTIIHIQETDVAMVIPGEYTLDADRNLPALMKEDVIKFVDLKNPDCWNLLINISIRWPKNAK